MAASESSGPQPTGLVLAGGGARGAYEAGALSVLLPVLEHSGKRPSILIGTSVGAINAGFLASVQHVGAAEASAGLVERWSEVSKGRVVRPIITRQAPLAVLRYAGEILSLPHLRLPSLLDPEPLEGNLKQWIDWSALRRNIDLGLVRAVAVVATAARTGRCVAFCDGRLDHDLHHSHLIEYERAELRVEHVRASAAIPILFPPVRVEQPQGARGWYFDGGTRLHTPIKPALDLGADRIAVVATESVEEPSSEDGRHDCEPPDFGDGALHLLQGTLVDPLVEDLRMLGDVNRYFTEDAPAAQRYRQVRGKPPYRRVPYVFVGPPQRGAIGELAMEVFRSRYGGLKGLRSPDFPFLNRLLGGDSPTHGELLSYLFFDPEFIERLMEMGRRDAERWVRPKSDPWRIEPLEAFLEPSESGAGSPATAM
jgi:NTE family protein